MSLDSWLSQKELDPVPVTAAHARRRAGVGAVQPEDLVADLQVSCHVDVVLNLWHHEGACRVHLATVMVCAPLQRPCALPLCPQTLQQRGRDLRRSGRCCSGDCVHQSVEEAGIGLQRRLRRCGFDRQSGEEAMELCCVLHLLRLCWPRRLRRPHLPCRLGWQHRLCH
jgi:hypothetical protein